MDLALDKKRKSKTISFSFVRRRKRKVSLPPHYELKRYPQAEKEKMFKRIIIWIGTLTTLVIGIIFLSAYVSSNLTFIDHPTRLSNRMDTIQVGYVNWACDCANFYETNLYVDDTNYKLKAEDCIFIEAADGNNKIPKGFFNTDYRNQDLKLIGQF